MTSSSTCLRPQRGLTRNNTHFFDPTTQARGEAARTSKGIKGEEPPTTGTIPTASPLQHKKIGNMLKTIRAFPIVYHSPYVLASLSKMGLRDMAQSLAKHDTQIAGRLSLFVNNWRSITNDKWVLNWLTTLQSSCSSHKRRGNDRDQHQSEGTELICGDTPLLDGKCPSAEREGDWMTKVDLKDAYFMILMSPAHRHLLRFRWEGYVYQMSTIRPIIFRMISLFILNLDKKTPTRSW